MAKNKLFRFLYWLTASFFFFAAAAVIISYLRPGPTEIQVEQWMSGMMSAMHNSLMGASMDTPEVYSFFLTYAAQLSLFMIVVGGAVGFILRMWKAHD